MVSADPLGTARRGPRLAPHLCRTRQDRALTLPQIRPARQAAREDEGWMNNRLLIPHPASGFRASVGGQHEWRTPRTAPTLAPPRLSQGRSAAPGAIEHHKAEREVTTSGEKTISPRRRSRRSCHAALARKQIRSQETLESGAV
ncbi:unnamed protein product [Lampetra fluviatilis]